MTDFNEAIHYALELIRYDWEAPSFYEGFATRNKEGSVSVPIYCDDREFIVTVWTESDGNIYGEY